MQISLNTARKHPVAIVLYAMYLLLWICFIGISTSTNVGYPLGENRYCTTGFMVVFFMMLTISAVYFIATFLFVIFSINKKFYLQMAVAVLLPLILAFIWQALW